MSIMTYKGYNARVEFDDDDGIFFGRIVGIKDVVGFHADTVGSLRAAFHKAVDDYLVACAKFNKAPDREYSGKVMLRLDPELHARIAKTAELAGMSINQWGERVLSQAVHGATPSA
jgi:predicted HicB family RNase H-like nuclease